MNKKQEADMEYEKHECDLLHAHPDDIGEITAAMPDDGVRREGKEAFSSLADDHVMTILRMGLEHINE